jgi:hypothetical protein
VTRYLRPFCKGLRETVGQTGHEDTLGSVAGNPLAGTIYEVFNLIKKHYTLQEHEKGGPAYIWRVVRDVGKKFEPQLVFGIDTKTAVAIQTRRQRGYGHVRGHEGSEKRQLGVDAGVGRLAARGLPVSRVTLYRWIREKKIHVTQNKPKRILLDEAAFEQAEALVRLRLFRLAGRESDGGPEEDI